MAIAFTTATIGLFPRLGRLIGAFNEVNTLLGTTTDNAVDKIDGGYDSSLQHVIDGLYNARDAFRDSGGSADDWKKYLRDTAAFLITETVYADNPRVSRTDLTAALKEVILQMGTADDVDAGVITASAPTYGATNNGDGRLAVTVRDGKGRTSAYVFDEDWELTCTSDSQGQNATATAGSEAFLLLTEAEEGNPLSYNWPKGSGQSRTMVSIDGTLDAQADGNLLRNSDFQAFTSNTPDDWSVLVGVAGTDIFDGGSDAYENNHGLEFTGTGGGPLSSVAQLLDGTDGLALQPSTVYLWHLKLKKSAGAVAGAIEVRLLDGANAAVTDDAGATNTTTIANGSITTSFTSFTGSIVTPRIIPATGLKINVRVSTAVTSTESIHVGRFALAAGTLVYDGGPYAALFSGKTIWAIGDTIAVAINNDYGGQFQIAFERFFNMRELGLQLPEQSDGSETVLDSLITTA